jgi:hypothetical protein
MLIDHGMRQEGRTMKRQQEVRKALPGKDGRATRRKDSVTGKDGKQQEGRTVLLGKDRKATGRQDSVTGEKYGKVSGRKAVTSIR